MSRVALMLAAVILAGCTTTKIPPSVTNFNGDSVTVSVLCGLTMECAKPRAEDIAQAESTCRTRQRTAKFASTSFRTVPSLNYTSQYADHLFLCA